VAEPKVCGNDPALGSFVPGSCPTLKDDGVAPDEAAGDGIYTVQVTLSPTAQLEYKILPNGVFDGTLLGQTGTCDIAGGNTNTFSNILVPAPDTSRPVRFFYDSRTIGDPTYAAPVGNRSGGEDLMLRSPAARCPQWLAVGDFQSVPFDRTVGAVQLLLQRPGVLIGRLTATKMLASGWQWKVVQAGTPSRRYGPGGWADDPCDPDSVKVNSAVKPGDIVYFTWHSYYGRLQTVVLAPGADVADGGVMGGLTLCPTPADPGDLGTGADLAATAPADGATTSPDGDSGDGGGRPLPGIHCNCQLGGAGGQLPPLGVGVSFVMAAAYLVAGARRGAHRRMRKVSLSRRAAGSPGPSQKSG
jgi:hypothetical protein